MQTLLNSNAKLLFTPKRGITGAVHRVSISNAEVYQDLKNWVLLPGKVSALPSLKYLFPLSDILFEAAGMATGPSIGMEETYENRVRVL